MAPEYIVTQRTTNASPWHNCNMKNERINTRLPAHLRLGAELLAAKHGVGLSTIVQKALADFLYHEGITVVPENELVSIVERLLPLQPGARIVELAKHRPDLLSAADRVWLAGLQEEEKNIGHSLDNPEVEAFYAREWGNFL